MKKIFSYPLFIVIYIFLLPFTIFPQSPGDVNSDSSINIIDALLVAQHYVGLEPSNFNQDVADTNCDGTINIIDALLIAQFYVGLISGFPECEETPAATTAPTGVVTPPITNPPTPIGTQVTMGPTPEGVTSTATPLPPTISPSDTTPEPTPGPQGTSEEIEWHKKIGGSCGDTPAAIQLTSDNGYIIAGYSCSTNCEGCIFQGISDYYIVKLDPEGTIEWQRMYGGSDADYVFSIEETYDHGYINAGISLSADIEGCTNHGDIDSYIVKLDGEGGIEWQTMIGGSGADYARSIQATNDSGYIFAGYSYSTDIEGCGNNGSGDCYVVKLDAFGTIEWQKMFGGSGFDDIYSIRPTSDNGYICAGSSASDDIEGCTRRGISDIYLVKLDTNGTIEWQTMIGGNSFDEAFSMEITPDNGYIIGATSYSTDISECFNHGEADYYIVKCDAEGTVEWQRMVGGNAEEYLNTIGIAPDAGVFVAGYSFSTDIEGCTLHGDADCYIAKLDMNGNTEWHEMIGGSDWEEGNGIQAISANSCIVVCPTISTDIPGCINYGETDFYIAKLTIKESSECQRMMIGGSDGESASSIRVTPDNGYLIAGSSNSTDIEGCINHGYGDYYIVKFDFDENLEWQRMFGGNYVDSLNAVEVTPDNGYIVTGYSESNDIEGCEYNGGESDSYIAKLDAKGNIEWHTMIGGTNEEAGTAIEVTSDNGYLIAGYSGSNDIEGCTHHGSIDYHLAKFDADGNIEWQKMIGGSDSDYAYSLQMTPDHGFIVAGSSQSTDIEGCTNHGEADYYIVKLDADGNIEWQKMIGGNDTEYAYSVQITLDNGFIVTGSSYSTDIEGCTNHGQSDFYMVKFDAEGNIEWQKMFGGNDTEYAYSMLMTPDNGFIVAGYSYSTDIDGCPNHGRSDVYIVKFDAGMNIEWEEMIGGSDTDGAHSLVLSPTGDYYIIAGTSYSTDIVGCINHGSADFYIIKLE